MMTKSMRGFVELGDGRIYYEATGEGETLVLSHAGFLDSRMFDAQWDALAGRFHVVRYDMRGFGQSGTAPGPLCRRDDLRRLLEHLGVERTHFIGCSIGGQITLDLALEQPGLVSSLVLVGSTPSGFELQGEPPRYMMEMFDAAQQGDIERANELQIRIWLDGQYREPEQVDPELRANALEMNRVSVERGTFPIADMQPARPLDPPAETRLGEVVCPVLVVAGDLDHPEILRAADVMVGKIPGARKQIMTGCGHVPSFEQPEAFNQIVFEFLAGR